MHSCVLRRDDSRVPVQTTTRALQLCALEFIGSSVICTSSAGHSKGVSTMFPGPMLLERGNMAEGPVQQLVEALAAAVPTDWSAAEVERLHLLVLPAARNLAFIKSNVPQQTAADIQAYGKDKVVQALAGVMSGIIQGLDQQQITGTAPVQQACEVLCALSDVLYGALAVRPPPDSRGSSSRPQLPGNAGVTEFLQMAAAGEARCPTVYEPTLPF